MEDNNYDVDSESVRGFKLMRSHEEPAVATSCHDAALGVDQLSGYCARIPMPMLA